VRHRYPFQSLHWLRQQRVDRQATALGESAQRAARARGELARAESEVLQTERSISSLSAAEQARLDDGLVRVGDLEVVAEWRKGAAAELSEKAEQERRARAAHATAAAAEVVARRALASANNEAKMIDAHRNRFRAERSAQQELAEEEAASEQWTASHFAARRTR